MVIRKRVVFTKYHKETVPKATEDRKPQLPRRPIVMTDRNGTSMLLYEYTPAMLYLQPFLYFAEWHGHRWAICHYGSSTWVWKKINAEGVEAFQRLLIKTNYLILCETGKNILRYDVYNHVRNSWLQFAWRWDPLPLYIFGYTAAESKSENWYTTTHEGDNNT